jgi:hypothetical protein
MPLHAAEAGDAGWLLLSTAVALVAGAASGWVAAAFKRREAKKERIRQDVIRWANPILDAVKSLQSRLGNLLDDGLWRALDPGFAIEEDDELVDWAVSFNYVMPTTIFLFADYFAWIRLLEERLSFELFESEKTKDEFFKSIWAVKNALGHWPLEKDKGGDSRKEIKDGGRDTQVFALQQRAIGELMIQSTSDGPTTLSLPEFLAAYDSDPSFRDHLEPLRALLESLERNGKRWKRLRATSQALADLHDACERLLGVHERGLAH